MMRAPRITTDELKREQSSAVQALATLQRELAKAQIETPEPGFLTNAQWASQSNGSIPNMSRILRDGLAAGLLEKRMFRTMTGGGVKPIPYYRLIEKLAPRGGPKRKW